MNSDTSVVPVASLNAVKECALLTYEIDQMSLYLFDQAHARLEATRDNALDKRDFAAYGPLRPKGSFDRDACDEFMEWAAQHAAGCAQLRLAGSDLLRPTKLFVSSQEISRAMQAYAAADFPLEGFTHTDDEWLKANSLHSLRELINSSQRGRGVESLPFWTTLAFLLHDSGHWSLLVYERRHDRATLAESTLVHHDSLAPMHEEYAMCVVQMLQSSGIIRPDIEPVRIDSEARQQGGWQCGYASAARLMERVGKLNDSANAIISTPERMQRFLGNLVDLSVGARTCSQLRERYSRIYVTK